MEKAIWKGLASLHQPELLLTAEEPGLQNSPQTIQQLRVPKLESPRFYHTQEHTQDGGGCLKSTWPKICFAVPANLKLMSFLPRAPSAGVVWWYVSTLD